MPKEIEWKDIKENSADESAFGRADISETRIKLMLNLGLAKC